MKQLAHMARNEIPTADGGKLYEVIFTLSEPDYQRNKKGEIAKVENLSTVRFITDTIQIHELIRWLIDVAEISKDSEVRSK